MLEENRINFEINNSQKAGISYGINEYTEFEYYANPKPYQNT